MRTIEELREALTSSGHVRIVGRGSRLDFLPAWDGRSLSVARLSGVIAHDVDDHVVEAWAGTTVAELQEALGKRGQCLPLSSEPGLPAVVSGGSGTVGGLLAMNLPHALSAQCGGPRDWTLGMTVVRTDGGIAKCGSKAVKNVAGYDAHKLFVGSRGTLGAIAKVVLRTFPVKALPWHETEGAAECAGACYVMRVLRSDLAYSLASVVRPVAVDRAACTVWGLDLPAVPSEAWMLGPGGVRTRPPQPLKYETMARQLFDPSGVLAPGWRE